jgi:hypothetical protein
MFPWLRDDEMIETFEETIMGDVDHGVHMIAEDTLNQDEGRLHLLKDQHQPLSKLRQRVLNLQCSREDSRIVVEALVTKPRVMTEPLSSLKSIYLACRPILQKICWLNTLVCAVLLQENEKNGAIRTNGRTM